MAVPLQQHTFRTDIISCLRQQASRGASLTELIGIVQGELGYPRDFIVPVLGYFCQAFEVPLREMLPIREWQEGEDELTAAPWLARWRTQSTAGPTKT